VVGSVCECDSCVFDGYVQYVYAPLALVMLSCWEVVVLLLLLLWLVLAPASAGPKAQNGVFINNTRCTL